MNPTLQDVLEPLIGDYAPEIQQFIEVTTVTDGVTTTTTTTERNEIIPDYLWIASAVIFSLVLYSVLRMIGSMIGGRNK